MLSPYRFGTRITVWVLLGLTAAIPRSIVAQDARSAGVRQFGAVGDGNTDDTVAIQRAVDSKVGEVRFPRGVYRLSKTVTIDLDRVGPSALVGEGPARVIMNGDGPAFRFVGTHEGTAGPATFEGRVWSRQRTPAVRGLEIVGAHAKASGIEATGTMQLTITEVVVRRALHGIRLVKRNRNVIISNCHIYDNRGIGVFYDNVNLHQSNIIGCHISYNEGGGVVVRGGDVRNVHIGTCDIEGNMGDDDAPPTANVWFDSTGGSMGEAAIVGCTIQHDHRATDSANIRIDGESTPRPFTTETRHGNITIGDNVLSDVQVNIELANTRGVTITGNTMWKGYRHNLSVRNCESIVVANNVFDRNSRYHYGDGASSQNGILFVGTSGCTFQGNHLIGAKQQPAALIVRDCSRFNITANTILDSTACCVLLENVKTSRLSDCLIQNGQAADGSARLSLKIAGGGGNMITGNLLSEPLSVPDRGHHFANNVTK